MERVIDCPVCFDTDHCFEEMQKEFSSFMCFRCGFNSNTTFKYASNSKNDITSSSKCSGSCSPNCCKKTEEKSKKSFFQRLFGL